MSGLPPLVVKLGGSLHDAPDLGRLLALLATAPGPPRVVVPGGGPFADAVRAMQPRLGLDDAAAHRMALLAMAQLGLAFAAMAPGLVGAGSLAAVRARLKVGMVPVWLPLDLLAGAPEIEESWRVTSDSLALWIAWKLKAARLLLVKSIAVPASATAAELAGTGVLDAAFPELAARWPVPWRCVERSALTSTMTFSAAGGAGCPPST